MSAAGVRFARLGLLRRPAESAPLLGIAMGVLAYALFSVHDASIKWLVEELPTWQVLFLRSAAISVACVVIGRRRLLEDCSQHPAQGAARLSRPAHNDSVDLLFYRISLPAVGADVEPLLRRTDHGHGDGRAAVA